MERTKVCHGIIRDYIFILQPEHSAAIDVIMNKMMITNWKKHFSILDI